MATCRHRRLRQYSSFRRNRSLKPPRLDDPHAEDEKGILESVNKIHGLVNEESKHIPSERIVVGGFSQGAALSLLVSLTTEKKVSLYITLRSRILQTETHSG